MSKIKNKQLVNALSLSTNQFKQTNAVGATDLSTNPNPFVMPVIFDYTQADTESLIPGEGIKLVDLGANDSSGNIPVIGKRTSDADAIEGVVIFDGKSATKKPGDRISVAKKNAVINMEAGAAILRGAKVALVLASPGQVVTQTTETLFGKALDKATSAGDLIRIEVLSEGVV